MSMAERRHMHLGLFILGTGHHVAGWRLQDAEAGAENFPLIERITKTAERAKFDLVFFADALNTGTNVHPSVMTAHAVGCAFSMHLAYRARGDGVDHL